MHIDPEQRKMVKDGSISLLPLTRADLDRLARCAAFMKFNRIVGCGALRHICLT